MKKLLLGGVVLFGFFFFFLIFMLIGFQENETELQVDTKNLSPEVLVHLPMVEKYCKQFDIMEYIPYILAIIQVESGGTAVDVMQSSESLGLPPNTLGTDESIKQGCKYFSELLASIEAKECDLDTAIQAYNYGGGFVGYVAKRGKQYTFALAEAFGNEYSGGEKVNYPNPVAIAVNGGWRYGYGNMFYVALVKQYLTTETASGGFLWPVPAYYGMDWVTSTFGGRYNPVTGQWEDAHGAIDIGPPGGTPIYAAADGTVLLAEWHSSYGNFVKIKHDDVYATLYAHASQLLVSPGQAVKQGDIIARVGSTGNSTGNHLHFEVRENDFRIDPLKFSYTTKQ